MGLITLAVVLLSVTTLCYGAPRCHMEEAMACLDPIFDYANSMPKKTLVATNEDVDQLCLEMQDGIQCWDKFKTSCMTPIERELEILITEGSRTLATEYCTTGSDVREKYLKHVNCYNKITTSNKTREGVEYLLAVLEKFQNVPNSKKITYGCCAYRGTYNYIHKEIKDVCGQEALDVANEMVFMAAAQAPEIICVGFDPEDNQCKKLLPKEDTKPTGTLKKNLMYKWLLSSLKGYLDEEEK